MWIGVRPLDEAFAALADAKQAVRQNLRTLALGVAIANLVAWIFIGLSTTSYVATATVLLQSPADAEDQPERALILEGFASDSAEIENQIEIIESEQLLRSVLTALRPGKAITEAGFRRFETAISARRVGLSNVVAITGKDPDPAEAASLANVVAEGFLKSRVESAYDQASASRLETRLDDLRNQAQSAADAMRLGLRSTETLGDADASILTPASVALVPVAPHVGAILAFATVLGLLGTVASVAMRPALDPSIRTLDQLARTIDTDVRKSSLFTRQPSSRVRTVLIATLTRCDPDTAVAPALAARFRDAGFSTSQWNPSTSAEAVVEMPHLSRVLRDQPPDAIVYVVAVGQLSKSRLRATLRISHDADVPVIGAVLTPA